MNDMTNPIATILDAASVARNFLQVKLTTSLPRMHVADSALNAEAQKHFKDRGVKARKVLFSDPANPMRVIANTITMTYRDHTEMTNPFEDRGPRLLSTALYDMYTKRMRDNVANIDKVKALWLSTEEQYRNAVQMDIDYRNSLAETPEERTASFADYPTYQDVQQSFTAQFKFLPVPERSHFGNTVSEEDRATLDSYLQEVADAARRDMINRIREPAKHLLDKLSKELKAKDSIFRDSAIENITEACALVEKMCAEDADIMAACAELRSLAAAFDSAKEQLRESPVVREAAAKKLAAVEAKLAGFFGG